MHQHHTIITVIKPEELANKMEGPSASLIIVDCRSGQEFSTCHICGAVNIGGSRSTRRDILSGRVSVTSLLCEQIGRNCNRSDQLIVYDQCSVDSGSLQSLAAKVADELSQLAVNKVSFLKGGFIGFQSKFSNLCWTNKHKRSDEDFVTPSQTLPKVPSSASIFGLTTHPQGSPSHKSAQQFIRYSLSGPALPSGKEGPTTVLPYLLLGTQDDALNHSCMLKHAITHIVNVSTDGPKSPFISPHNFLRIPVLDNFADKITPYFPDAFKFLDDVKLMGGRALVHCSAGISRSPTLAIGYLMKTKNITVTEAYNIVKSSRVSVSPNFNFMGQLTDYENMLKTTVSESLVSSSNALISNKSISTRHKRRPSRLGFFSTLLKARTSTSKPCDTSSLTTPMISVPLLPSPSVPFARLGINSPMEESPGIRLENFPTTSLDQLHFQPCQTGPRGIKIKRSATQVDNDCSNISKRLSTIASRIADISEKLASNVQKTSNDGLLHADHFSIRRHSSILPLTSEISLTESPTTLLKSEASQDKLPCLSGRSVSYEKINCSETGAWNQSSITTDSCRLQECHHSTSSLSSANSHSSNLLV